MNNNCMPFWGGGGGGSKSCVSHRHSKNDNGVYYGDGTVLKPGSQYVAKASRRMR